MADYKLAIPDTIKSEGGIINSSSDPGKLTYVGVSSAKHPEFEGWPRIKEGIVKAGFSVEQTLDCSANDRKKIDDVLAEDAELQSMILSFYKKEYWDALDLDDEPDQDEAAQIFDVAVNMGIGEAKKIKKVR